MLFHSFRGKALRGFFWQPVVSARFVSCLSHICYGLWPLIELLCEKLIDGTKMCRQRSLRSLQ